MKIAVIFLALSLTSPLASCDTIKAATSGSVAQAAPAAMLAAEKGLTIAHLAYNDVGRTLIVAANSGALRGANAATAKVWHDKAGDALNAADAADKAANAQGVAAAVSAAEDAIAQASAIVNPKK